MRADRRGMPLAHAPRLGARVRAASEVFMTRVAFRSSLVLGCLSILSACSGASPNDAPTDTAPLAASDDAETIDAPDRAAVESDIARSDYVDTPNGSFHKSCIYELGDDETIEEDGSVVRPDGSRFTPAACAHEVRNTRTSVAHVPTDGEITPTINGWAIAADDWQSRVWMKSLFADWHVPKAPSVYRAQLVYLFPSLEDMPVTRIIQPVLQYGPNGAFGGKGWVLASWYVGPNNVSMHSKPIGVKVGDYLSGMMLSSGCTSHGACTWDISSIDVTRNTSTKVRVKSGNAFKAINGGVLEVYRVTACSELPASGTRFFN